MLGENKQISNTTLFLSKTEFGDESISPISVIPNKEIIVKKDETQSLVKDEIIGIYNLVKKAESPLSEKPIYVKNFIRFSSNKIQDESELIRSEIADLLYVSVPRTVKIYSPKVEGLNTESGILVCTNLDTSVKEISMADKFSIIFKNLQSGIIKESYPEYRIPRNKTKEAIKDANTIKIVINKGLNALPRPTLEKDQKRAIKDYLRMIILDYIMNQTNRNGEDYSYYTNITKEKVKEKVLVRLQDGSTGSRLEDREITAEKVIIIPGIGKYKFLNSEYQSDEYSLNDFIVNKDALLEVLLTDYKEYVRGVIDPLTEAKDRYKECISRIIYNNTNKENAAFLENMIFTNIDRLCEIAKTKKEARVGNKVELASTTTQQNLAILSKEESILKKYPNNPKATVEEPLVSTDNRLVLKAEPSNNNKIAGYTSTVLIASAIALLGGLGFGIAFILTNMP